MPYDPNQPRDKNGEWTGESAGEAFVRGAKRGAIVGGGIGATAGLISGLGLRPALPGAIVGGAVGGTVALTSNLISRKREVSSHIDSLHPIGSMGPIGKNTNSHSDKVKTHLTSQYSAERHPILSAAWEREYMKAHNAYVGAHGVNSVDSQNYLDAINRHLVKTGHARD